MEHLYDGFNDLNECWTNAEPRQRAALTAGIKGAQPAQKAYDTSASTEARRTLDARRGPTNSPSFT